MCLRWRGLYWWFVLVLLLSLNVRSLQVSAVPNLEACVTVARFPVPPQNCAKYASEGMLLPDDQKHTDAVCGAGSQSRWNGMEGNVGVVIGYHENVAWGDRQGYFNGCWLIFIIKTWDSTYFWTRHESHVQGIYLICYSFHCCMQKMFVQDVNYTPKYSVFAWMQFCEIFL